MISNLLKDIIAYILQVYDSDKKDNLSNARVTKLVFLVDWVYAFNYDTTVTDIKWYFDNFGPFVRDIENCVKENDDIFEIQNTQNTLGNEKKLFCLIKEDYVPKLDKKVITVINHVIKRTKDKNFNEFIKYVYGTYPIMTSEKYSFIDLKKKAEEYQMQDNI